MGNEQEFEVMPEYNLKILTISRIALDKQEESEVSGTGCIFGVLMYAILVCLAYVLSKSLVQSVLISFFVALIISKIIKYFKIPKIERKKSDNKKREERERAEEEARRITKRMLSIYKSSIDSFNCLPEQLQMASFLLQKAEVEYSQNAFALFWDNVERAAGHLSVYNDEILKISRNAEEYMETLRGKSHTFPGFPVKSFEIPSATEVTSVFRKIVRLGQTNYEFASILEHRMTRTVLICGFKSLGEAINNLSSTIDKSVAELHNIMTLDM